MHLRTSDTRNVLCAVFSCVLLLAPAILVAEDVATAADRIGPDGLNYPDFSRAGIPGGIPMLPVIVDATDFGARSDDEADDAVAIQAAIEAAASRGGGAVMLPAGNYYIDAPLVIRHDGVVLRGAGRASTRLIPRFQGQDLSDKGPSLQVLEIAPLKVQRRYDVYPDTAIRRGDFSVHLPEKNHAVVKVGDIVVLTATPPTSVIAALAPGLQKQAGDGSYGSIYCWQYLEVLGVEEDVITFAQPIRLDLALDQRLKLMHVPVMVRGSGVEDLSVIQAVTGKNINGLTFESTRDCWVRGVDVLKIGNYPVSWGRSWHFEMRDCRLDESLSRGGAKAYFGFGFACDGLIDQVRATRLRHLSISMASNGLVFRNCFLENIDINFHLNWPHEILFENCHVDSGLGPKAAPGEEGRGSYGFGIYTPRLDGDMHTPAGPRLTFYHNHFVSRVDGLMLGGGATQHTVVAYNTFDVAQSFAAVIRAGSQGSVICDNVFVLRDPNQRRRWMAAETYGHPQPESLCGAVLFLAGHNEDVAFIRNRFYGAPAGDLFVGGQPGVADGNQNLQPTSQRAGDVPPGTVGLRGDWRVRMVQSLAATADGNKLPDPGLSDAARALLGEDCDDTQWPTLPMPAMFSSAPLDFAAFDGEAVIRRRFDLPTGLVGTAAILSLGTIDDYDETWINGTHVGTTVGADAWKMPRRYTIPAGLLRAQGNVIAIRVWDAFGGGGLGGTPDQVWIGKPQPQVEPPLPVDIAAPKPPVPSLYEWQCAQRKQAAATP